MNCANEIFNQTFLRCLEEFSMKCLPSCGTLYSRELLSICINVSVQTTFERIKYGLDYSVNSQYNSDIAVPFYGFITPILAIITVVFNMFVMCLLMSKPMRSPTNSILSSIAFSDTVTILSPLPWYIHTYGTAGYKDYPLYDWCVIFRYFGFMVPTCFHNCAVWYTAMLSIHRYIGIAHPNAATTLCSYRSVAKGHLCIFVIICLLIFSQLIFEDISKATVISKKMFNSEGLVYIDTCYAKPKVSADAYKTYFEVYLCLRIVFTNIIPCTILIIFNTVLIRKTYKSYSYRQKLVNGNKTLHHLEVTEVVRTTIMLISVCVLTLLVEILYGTLFSIQTAKEILKISVPNLKTWLTIPNFTLFLTYPAHFVIYCTLNQRFRKYLWRYCCKQRHHHGIYSVSNSIEKNIINRI